MRSERSRVLLLTGAGLAVVLLLLALWWPRDGAPAGIGAVVVPAEEEGGSQVLRLGRSRVDPSSAAAKQAGGAKGGPNDPAQLARLSWGSGSDQVGRERPEEANAEGPMSFAVDGQGRALVLDQVNGRILRLDEQGNPQGEVPIPVRAAQDLAVAEDGRMAVLDRLGDRTVAILDAEGKLIGELALEGKGVEEGGGVTGVFVDGEDVYVEREHGPLVKLGDLSGVADPERPEIPGRPSRDGKYFLTAGLIDPLAGRAYVNAVSRPAQDHLYTREYRLGIPLVAILALDTDLQGVIYLALLAELPQSSPTDPPRHAVRLLCLNAADGAPIGQAELPATTLPEETFRDFAIQDQGGVIYAYRTEEGVSYQRADCR